MTKALRIELTGLFWKLLLATLLLLTLRPAWADGVLIPDPRPELPRPVAFGVKYHRVDVTINESIARTEIDQVFTNPNGVDLEATYIFPIPENAALSEFAMWIDGQRQEAELREADAARKIYEDIVRSMRDPALLEYMGRNLFKARVYPVPARGEKRIALGYSQVLDLSGTTYEYRYPLNTEKFSSTLLDEVRVKVTITASRPIRNVYSPSHKVEVDPVSDTMVIVTYEENRVRPSTDFRLFYTLQTRELTPTVLSYREGNENGYFLVLLSPSVESEEAVLPKDVVFVLDTSGSMAGEKIKQAREALIHALRNLNRHDRYGIVSFASGIRPFREQLAAVGDGLDPALAFARALEAQGGTNIAGALKRAAEMLPRNAPGRVQLVVFMTDGLPTVGEDDPKKIMAALNEQLGTRVRVFPFGVGTDVNTDLLDNLAADHRGSPAYIKPGENLEERVSGFYNQIANPILTEIAMTMAGADLYDVEPGTFPDLYRGTQVVVAGRYRSPGDRTLVLKGTGREGAQTLEFPVHLTADNKENSFIARLWAIRRVGALLLEIRKKGENAELKEEVIGLAKAFGLVTPYTSYLVLEPSMTHRLEDRDDGIRPLTASASRPAPASAPAAPSQPAREMASGRGMYQSTGADAVGTSTTLDEMKESEGLAGEERFRGNAVRSVGRRNFLYRDNAWVEEGLDLTSDTTVVTVTAFSDEYFKLAAHPEVAKIIALGPAVAFRHDGKVYRIKAD